MQRRGYFVRSRISSGRLIASAAWSNWRHAIRKTSESYRVETTAFDIGAGCPMSSGLAMLFKLSSDYKPTGDQPQAIAKLVASIAGWKPVPDAPRGHGLGQDVHHGQRDRPAATGRSSSSATTRPWPPSSTRSSRASSRRTRSSTSSATTTTTSPRPTSPRATPTSRRTPRSTRRSSGCGCRRRAPWSAGGT